MDIPRFPAPPALVSRSISLDPASNNNSGGDGGSSTTITVRRRRSEFSKRRPRSASWLVTRKRSGAASATHNYHHNNNNNNNSSSSSSQNKRSLISSTAATIAANGRNFILSNNYASYHGRRNNHVQPLELGCAAREAYGKEVRTEVQVTMTESRYDAESAADDDDAAATNARGVESCVGVKVLDRISEDPSSCYGDKSVSGEDHVDEAAQIVCRDARMGEAKLTESIQCNAAPACLSPVAAIPERLSPIRPMYGCTLPPLIQHKTMKSQSVQTIGKILYRLRVFPTLKDIVDEENRVAGDTKKSGRVFRCCRFLGRLALCQFGLAWLLSLWAVAGASLFYITEGPRERQQVVELKDMQRDLAVGLATELRQLRAEDRELEPLWSNKVRQYVARHEKLLLMAVSSGYGEGGDNGQLWTFPGCVLFSISVLTTLGFGAPVPRTNAGRTVAVVFASIGIPAHFLLILNLGLLLAVRLKRYGIRKKYRNECRDLETIDSMPMPMWVKVMPFLTIAIYYVIGILCFGVARYRPFSDSLLFPLDFTAAGGLSTTAGYIRILYGLYLEGAVTLTAIAVAIMKVAATQSLTNVGLRYGLLVPA